MKEHIFEMMTEKQFQYEIQLYQEACIGNIVGIFDALLQNQPFNEVMTAHHAAHRYHLHSEPSA